MERLVWAEREEREDRGERWEGATWEVKGGEKGERERGEWVCFPDDEWMGKGVGKGELVMRGGKGEGKGGLCTR